MQHWPFPPFFRVAEGEETLAGAAAMRAFLRADPDVLMVDEMRDSETAHISIDASLTRHMVMSTLHTNSAPESVIRILNMGLDRRSVRGACS